VSLCRNTISLKAAKSWSQFLYRQNCDLNRNVCSSGYLINNKQCAKTRYFYDLQFKREALRPIIMGILIYWRGDLLWFTLESIWNWRQVGRNMLYMKYLSGKSLIWSSRTEPRGKCCVYCLTFPTSLNGFCIDTEYVELSLLQLHVIWIYLNKNNKISPVYYTTNCVSMKFGMEREGNQSMRKSAVYIWEQ